MAKNIKSTAFGYPKIGPNRELKKAVEDYWNSNINQQEFSTKIEEIRLNRLNILKESGLDFIPSNDFSLYDQTLDLSLMFGVIPDRFNGFKDDLDLYFAMARGNKDAVACEMTKWFDTNYHYIVPEITGKEFKLLKNRPLESYKWAKDKLGIETVPNLIGPFTYLSLSKGYDKNEFREILLNLASVYNIMLKELEQNGVQIVQLDEPSLVTDISDEEADVLIETYHKLTEGLNSLDIYVQTYYESLTNYQKIVNELPVQGIGLDFAVNNDNLVNLRQFGFQENKKLIAGIVSGRDPWKAEYKAAVELINELSGIVSNDLIIANSSPLFHLPVSVEAEQEMNPDLKELLSFANERLEELETIKEIINNDIKIPNQNLDTFRAKFKNHDVTNKLAQINGAEIQRSDTFEERFKKQREVLNLPLFPTTTIGSFPQTKDVRKARADYKKNLISREEYEDFIKDEIKKVIKLQEEIGLDVLVHGEFERTDMVEFFAEKLDGIDFTKHGWVQSYGTRCVRPPIIYGDVSRPEVMVLEEVKYAQSLTEKPVKAILTGPVTILNWSFYRKDISKKEIAYQIALALKDEVSDLELGGAKIIQIDEAAFREGAPLKKSKQADYYNWAAKSFRITNEQVKPETQIHTHMCYSEFNDIIDSIEAMDADVIAIEASRSKGEIIEVFEKTNYNHGIGIGVYDIHSPRVPSIEEIKETITRSIKVIDKNLFWINPDCGLKTRGYEETILSLRNMVDATRQVKSELLIKK